MSKRAKRKAPSGDQGRAEKFIQDEEKDCNDFYDKYGNLSDQKQLAELQKTAKFKHRLNEHGHVEIKDSLEPKAGAGLFAKHNIRPKDKVAGYYGVFVSEERAHKLNAAKSKGSRYTWQLMADKSMPGMRYVYMPIFSPAYFANVRLLDDGVTEDESAANAPIKFKNDGSYSMFFLHASEKIEKGEEILTSYGEDYWKHPEGEQTSSEEEEKEEKEEIIEHDPPPPILEPPERKRRIAIDLTDDEPGPPPDDDDVGKEVQAVWKVYMGIVRKHKYGRVKNLYIALNDILNKKLKSNKFLEMHTVADNVLTVSTWLRTNDPASLPCVEAERVLWATFGVLLYTWSQTAMKILDAHHIVLKGDPSKIDAMRENILDLEGHFRTQALEPNFPILRTQVLPRVASDWKTLQRFPGFSKK